jgi:hypothetical protein
MATWYYMSGGQQCGPVEKEALRKLITSGALPPDSLVWRDSIDGWRAAHAVPELTASSPPPPPNVVSRFMANAFSVQPNLTGAPVVGDKLKTPTWVRILVATLGFIFLIRALHLPWQTAAAFEYVRGQYAESEENYGEAARLYRLSLQIWPESPTVLGHLGVVSVHQSDNKTLGWVFQRLAEVKDPHPSNVEEARENILKALIATKKGH